MAKPHVLIVEDQQEFQKALTFRLEGQGYEVEIAEDGQAADLCIGIHSFDIVLMNDELADGSSRDRLREWRHKGHKVPVILLMAPYPGHPVADHVPEHAEAFIRKPFAISDLMLEMERVLVSN